MNEDIELSAAEDIPTPAISMDEYREGLKKFDISICEALAVGQAAANRLEAPHVGYSTHIFARICAHATALVRAAPKSRWVHSDSEHWEFAAVAGHARSIIEGYLLFVYVAKRPSSQEEWSAKLNVMHLNDCTRRIRVFEGLEATDQVSGFKIQAEELRERLRKNVWFRALDGKLQSRLLSGDYLTISTRNEQLEELGWPVESFYSIWHVLSQYTHVLPFSFYRLEPNGRGTGISNDFDRSNILIILNQCSEILSEATDRMVGMFPDVAAVRVGIDSKFSPGPHRNLPKFKKRRH